MISLGVQYVMRPGPAGSEVEAAISVEGGGLFGRVLAKVTEALLAAGALHMLLERIARELEPGLLYEPAKTAARPPRRGLFQVVPPSPNSRSSRVDRDRRSALRPGLRDF